VLLRACDSPAHPTWASETERPLRVVALDRFLPQWLEREPENPFVAVFAPLVIEDDAELRALAPTIWRRVHQASICAETRDLLSQVLEFRSFERFRDLSAKEIWTMLNLSTPIEKTRAYQSIFAKGKAEGKTEGKAEGKVETLSRQLTRRFGPLPAWAIVRIDAATIDQLNTWLDGIFDADRLEALIGPETDE
jgi:predicted transposase YdaD